MNPFRVHEGAFFASDTVSGHDAGWSLSRRIMKGGVCPYTIYLDGMYRTALPLLVGFCYMWYNRLMFSYEFVTYEGEVVPDHSVKAYRGSRGIAPPICNLGTRWR
jgi:hypothetical protein